MDWNLFRIGHEKGPHDGARVLVKQSIGGSS